MKLGSVLWDYLDGWEWEVIGGRVVQEGGDIYTHTADFLHHTTETNTIL